MERKVHIVGIIGGGQRILLGRDNDPKNVEYSYEEAKKILNLYADMSTEHNPIVSRDESHFKCANDFMLFIEPVKGVK